MKIIACDPGKNGAWAITSWSLTGYVMAVDVFPMPDSPAGIVDLLEPHAMGPCDVFVEKAQSFRGQGVTSSFNYGVGFGEIIGILTALKMKLHLVPPQTWTRVLHVGCSGTDPKKKSLQAVRRLYPGQKLTFGDRAKKPHDGLADALLLANYGRRVLIKD